MTDNITNSTCDREGLIEFLDSNPEDLLWQWAAALWSNIVLSALSVLASLVILFSYCFIRKLRNQNYLYGTLIAFSDLCVSISRLSMTGGMKSALFEIRFDANSTSSHSVFDSQACGSPLCFVSAVVQQYFHLAEYLWISVLAFSLYLTMVHQKTIDKNFARWSHGIVWGISLIFAIVPAATECYGSSGHWCWIKSAPAKCNTTKYVSLYAWLFALYAFNLFCYVSAEIALCRDQSLRVVAARLRLYLLAFNVINLPTLINLCYLTTHEGGTLFGLFWFMSITEPAKGVVNAFIFGCNAHTIRVYREALCKESVQRSYTDFNRPTTMSELVAVDYRSPNDDEIFDEDSQLDDRHKRLIYTHDDDGD